MKTILIPAMFLLALSLASEVQAQNDQAHRNFAVVTNKAAQYPGGDEALYRHLHRNMQYPAEAKKNKVQGDVYVSFYVEQDSTVSGVEALNDLGYGTKEEAIRLVKGLKFGPAIQNGQPFRTSVMIPVLFRIYE